MNGWMDNVSSQKLMKREGGRHLDSPANMKGSVLTGIKSSGPPYTARICSNGTRAFPTANFHTAATFGGAGGRAFDLVRGTLLFARARCSFWLCTVLSGGQEDCRAVNSYPIQEARGEGEGGSISSCRIPEKKTLENLCHARCVDFFFFCAVHASA